MQSVKPLVEPPDLDAFGGESREQDPISITVVAEAMDEDHVSPHFSRRSPRLGVQLLSVLRRVRPLDGGVIGHLVGVEGSNVKASSIEVGLLNITPHNASREP